MTRAERIKNILDEKGTIKTEIIEVAEGCDKIQGLCIGEYQTRFTVYPDKMDFTDEEILTIIDEMSKETPPQFDSEIIGNWEKAKEHLRLCVRPITYDDAAVVPFLDLEKYVRIFLNEHASVKITDQMIEFYGISKEEVFDEAEKQSVYLVNHIIEKMTQINKNLGNETETICDVPLCDVPLCDVPLYVVTNKDMFYGASSICNQGIMEMISSYLEIDAFYVIPSSVHEIIVCPVQIGLDLIRRIHLETLEAVDDNDFLSKHIYMYNRFNGDGKMIIAC